jgi:glycosyltransferase involved in cell wall biosynthesis
VVDICAIGTNHDAHGVRVYHRICRSLTSNGFEVDWIAQSDGSREFVEGIHFHELGKYSPSVDLRPLTRLQRIRQAFSIAKRLNAALFQFHSPEFIVHAITLKNRTEKPVVFDCMEDFESYVRQRPGIPWWLRPLAVFGTRHLLRKAGRKFDAVLTADPGTAEFFRPFARRVLPLYNFPVLRNFPDSSRKHHTAYDLVHHGRLNKHHLIEILNIDEALQDRNHFVKWYLFGSIPEREWFLTELKSRGVSDRFRIEKRILHSRVMGEVQKAKIGIIPLPDLPKYHNNVPGKLFEFMAMRMPVVMSDLPPSRSFISDDKYALRVKPSDYEAFADAIVHLLDNPELCRKMGKEGRLRVEKEYNWSAEFNKLLDLYNDLLAD